MNKNEIQLKYNFLFIQNHSLLEKFIRNNIKNLDIDFNLLSEKKLSEKFILDFLDKLDFIRVQLHSHLSEKFIRKFKDKVDWNYISKYQQLSENFIREFQDKVNWDYISRYQKLSENFIREFQDKIDWHMMSAYQNLSSSFIKEFESKLSMLYLMNFKKLDQSFVNEKNINHFLTSIQIDENYIDLYFKKINKLLLPNQVLSDDFISNHYSTAIIGLFPITENYIKSHIENKGIFAYISLIARYQNLSDDIIDHFANELDWYYLSRYQKLSEKMILKYSNKIDWDQISIFQKLSEAFIENNFQKLNLNSIIQFQKLSENFRKKYNINPPKDNWLYVSQKTKLDYLKKINKYEIIDDKYIIAYKICRMDNYSFNNFNYRYFKGKTYTSHCNCSLKENYNFGLFVSSKDYVLQTINLKDIHRLKLLKVKININDIGAIVGNIIRCKKISILDEEIISI